MIRFDKRDRARLLRRRLTQAMEERGLTQSALARGIGVDRSTVSQLLTGDGARIPNAHVVGECAATLGVSADWLLGLSDRPESAADLLATSLTITKAPYALIDEQILDWYKEAVGYKIRYVPANLPDILKTRELLEWECRPHLGGTTEQAVRATTNSLKSMRESRSDFEIAFSAQELESFARAEGYYADLPAPIRRAQFDQLSTLYDQLYPTLRVHLFDARRIYSAPLTVFGPLLAVLYLGHYYLTFRDVDRIQTLTRHFDGLVREAAVTDHGFMEHLKALRAIDLD